MVGDWHPGSLDLYKLYFFTQSLNPTHKTLWKHYRLPHHQHLLKAPRLLLFAEEDDDEGDAVEDEAAAVKLDLVRSGHLELRL